MTKLIKLSKEEFNELLQREKLLIDSSDIRKVSFKIPKRFKNVTKVHIGIIFTKANFIPIESQLSQLQMNCHLIYIDKDACDCDESLYPDIYRLKMEEVGQIANKILKSGRRVALLTYMLMEEEYFG